MEAQLVFGPVSAKHQRIDPFQLFKITRPFFSARNALRLFVCLV
jgi:hypothetical protein